MAIEFEKGKIKGGFPVFWRGECKVLLESRHFQKVL